MDQHLLRAYDYARHGRFTKAIRSCKKLLRSHNKLNTEQQSEVLYFLAYLHLMSEHQSRHSEWSVFGVDLRQPYFNAYHKAMHYLDRLGRFDPSEHDMPEISDHDWIALNEFAAITGHKPVYQ